MPPVHQHIDHILGDFPFREKHFEDPDMTFEDVDDVVEAIKEVISK